MELKSNQSGWNPAAAYSILHYITCCGTLPVLVIDSSGSGTYTPRGSALDVVGGRQPASAARGSQTGKT
ncbi:hypothetical protein CI102_12006 [Trichoderma harzianum]|nr:hypothetical protein CI102_12006 [Trichoderma harzianum]